ncbi:MAG: hypothetical protein WAT92_25590 [Saprospiraceae bacterium]
MMFLRLLKISCLLLFVSNKTNAQQDSVLLFVSYAETYYTEYIVMYEALTASGYFVDVRSSSNGNASTYTIGGDVVAQANGLGGSSYAQFQTQFNNMFAIPWNAALNAVPATIPVNGTIQNVTSMQNYKALVIAGGTGVNAYRVDGSYVGHGGLSNLEVQQAAEKLNALAIEAFTSGKPVLGQCHGASLPAFWRIPSTMGGLGGLGISLLDGSIATGYPEPETADNLSDLNITLRANDKVVIGTPHTALMDAGAGDWKILTSRDWYPQTIAHAANTLTNIIESYPDAAQFAQAVKVLIIHGGAVDVNNCGPGNQTTNDVPCNYGGGVDLPADFTDLVALYQSNQFGDGFSFEVDDVNLFTQSVFDPNDSCAIFTYLSSYDVVFFYKHWSSSVTNALQNALVNFADNGGGVVSIHHGLYNQDKNILVNNLFQAHSPAVGWGANRTTYNIFQTNYGHFVSSYNIVNNSVLTAPAVWNTNPLPTVANASSSYYQRFSIFDEIYTNMQFTNTAVFGDGQNQINPIFSNDLSPASQCHVHGFVKLFNPNADNSVGRVVYGQAGETIANYQYPHPYAQFLRNAVFWAGNNATITYDALTWTAGNGYWNLANNWSPQRLPGTCHDVLIPDQNTPIQIDLPANLIEIHSLKAGSNVLLQIPTGGTLNITRPE